MTAVGIPELAVFTVGWFARTVWRTGSGLMHVLPLLLVAVTFFFLAGETWMSIGRLSGLPLILTMTLIGALAVVALHAPGRRRLAAPPHRAGRRLVPPDGAEAPDARRRRFATPTRLRGSASGSICGCCRCSAGPWWPSSSGCA